MNDIPFFAVVIPLYNKSPYVRKAVESVLGQSFSDFELVVVDDGSQDGSIEAIADIHDDRMRIIRQANAGVSVARNNGVAQTTAPYICFLDADDWWDSEFLQQMHDLIKEYPDAGIYGTNYTIVNETKHKTRIAPIGLPQGFEKGYINYCRIYAQASGMPLWTGAVGMPREVFFECGQFPKGIKLGEDFILWIHIALQHKVVFLNKSLSFYNQDVDINNRGVGHLHEPQYHMLWNLKDLEEEEKHNTDYKQLIDTLRATSLLPYFISSRYHDAAVQELTKVDWSRQPKRLYMQYRKPVWLLRCEYSIRLYGSRIKQTLRQIKA